MATKNDVTGDSIRSRTSNKAYRDNWDRIFGKKKETRGRTERGKNNLRNKQQQSS